MKSIPYPFLFFYFLLAIMSIPQWNPPLEYDAYSYLEMAKGWWSSRDIIPAQHWQRPLPSLLTGLFTFFISRPPSEDEYKLSFYILSKIFFLFFCIKFYSFIDTKIKDRLLSFSLTLLVLLKSWPFFYNLANFFQLSDMLQYIFTLYLWEAWEEKKEKKFFYISLFSIFTRQNLIFFGLFGLLGFLLKKENKIQHSAYLFIFIVATTLLFSFSSFSAASSHINPKYLLESLFQKELYEIIFRQTIPFILLSFFYWKKITPYFFKNIPLFLFAFITLLQPLIYFSQGGVANTERIMEQGLWIFQVVTLFIFFKDTSFYASKNKYFYWILVFSPLLLGTKHLIHYHYLSIAPLFFLKNHFKDYLGLSFLIMAFLSQKKRGTHGIQH
mgnify:CR=1 FL=1